MRIFVTGATGFLGTAIVNELIHAGHQVLGLTRSEEGAQLLTSRGVDVHFGDIEDLESLRRGVELSDGVIHTAFNHDFSTFVANCEADRQAVEAMGSVLKGSTRPFVMTSVAALGAKGPGQVATEETFNLDSPIVRRISELEADKLVKEGVHVSVVRLPQVHDTLKQGLITYLISMAREKGVSAYVGQGDKRWAAVHLSDCARLYVLALERNSAGSRYNAVAEEGVSHKQIAEAIALGLNVPLQSIDSESANSHFSWLAPFMSSDMSASSTITQKLLEWSPTGPDLISDLQQMDYR